MRFSVRYPVNGCYAPGGKSVEAASAVCVSKPAIRSRRVRAASNALEPGQPRREAVTWKKFPAQPCGDRAIRDFGAGNSVADRSVSRFNV